MSNKPLKAGDQRQLEKKLERKRKQIESTVTLPPHTVIFCEGTKTEPSYIRGFAQAINTKYSGYAKHNLIEVHGTGRNTIGLLKYARRFVSQNYPSARCVYLMYDKDDFPHDNFDNTQFSAEEKDDVCRYHVAWSNECIELWFLLHFQEIDSNISRELCCSKLKDHLPAYEKNSEETYANLRHLTSAAIDRSRKLYDSYEPDTPPSQRTPATRVHELVLFLQQYT